MMTVRLVVIDTMLKMNSLEASALPRVGDKVFFKKAQYTVKDVLWDFDAWNVTVFLVLP